ncbi:MAG: hypothetical protein ACPGVD_05050 [Flavobacteriales bacterium]
MNVLFHTTAAIGVIAIAVKPNDKVNSLFSNNSFRQGIITFVLGLISHGVLDFAPHCYPINSKADAVISLIIMLLLCVLVKRRYTFAVGMAFLGSVFPDLIDLAPSILNSYLGTSIPEFSKLFPWHWHEYSGSIYSNQCGLSAINHTILIAAVTLIVWVKRKNLIQIFKI